jgi:hypothetical protein
MEFGSFLLAFSQNTLSAHIGGAVNESTNPLHNKPACTSCDLAYVLNDDMEESE